MKRTKPVFEAFSKTPAVGEFELRHIEVKLGGYSVHIAVDWAVNLKLIFGSLIGHMTIRHKLRLSNLACGYVQVSEERQYSWGSNIYPFPRFEHIHSQ